MNITFRSIDFAILNGIGLNKTLIEGVGLFGEVDDILALNIFAHKNCLFLDFSFRVSELDIVTWIDLSYMFGYLDVVFFEDLI